MKCILLAAGKGSRISKMIDDIPKSTLLVGGTPLIRRTVIMLEEMGIEPIVCVGYKADLVEKALEGTGAKVYNNPFFDVTNSIASLWFMREELDDDLIVMNADVFLEKDVLQQIVDDQREVIMAVDKTRIAFGDYFFGLNEDGCVVKYGKELPEAERDCEYVGIAKISKSFIPSFATTLVDMINEQKHGCWWEDVLYTLADKGEKIRTLDISSHFWREIDYYDDYEQILEYIEKNS